MNNRIDIKNVSRPRRCPLCQTENSFIDNGVNWLCNIQECGYTVNKTPANRTVHMQPQERQERAHSTNNSRSYNPNRRQSRLYDLILEYWKRYGGLSSSTMIKYILAGSELIVDSKDIYGRNNLDISNMRFLYSRDSLINKKTNEKYYNQKYLNTMHKK